MRFYQDRINEEMGSLLTQATDIGTLNITRLRKAKETKLVTHDDNKTGIPHPGRRVLVSGLSTDRVECELVKALHHAQLDLMVIPEPNSPGHRLCEQLAIPHRPLSFRHRLDGEAIRLYRGLLEEKPYEILHCLTNRALSTALWACRRRRQSPHIIGYRGTVGHLSRWDPASRLSYLNRRVARILCVSDAVRRYLLSFGIPADKLPVIWKGHDPDWYHAAPRAALAEWGIPADACVASFSGNVRPVKGLPVLLDAMEQVPAAHQLHLLVMGHVRDKKIAQRLQEQPRIHHAGFRSDAPALAGACDITVVPSIDREGLPKAALESMAQGVPVIVTRVGGLPELVEHGVSGLLVPPRDPEALAAALQTLATDHEQRRQLGTGARQRIEGAFHFRHTVAKTLAVYASLTPA